MLIPIILAAALASDATVLRCKFEKMPAMVLTFSGVGNSDSSLRIGARGPFPMVVGSTLSTATVGAPEFTFSLRYPMSVTVSAPGNDTITYGGDCSAPKPH